MLEYLVILIDIRYRPLRVLHTFKVKIHPKSVHSVLECYKRSDMFTVLILYPRYYLIILNEHGSLGKFQFIRWLVQI